MEESRTKEMRIDVDSYPPEVHLFSTIPGLKHIPSWKYKGRMEHNKLCKYIIYVYSMDSYLNKIRTPLEERKKKALLHAGFKMNELGEFDGEVMNFIYHLQSDEILNIVHDYLRYQNETVWSEIIITEHEVDEATRIRLKPMETEDKKGAELKKRLREDVKDMNDYLDGLYRKFYSDHIDVKNRKRATTLEVLAKNLQEV